jgi:hypothetical protein
MVGMPGRHTPKQKRQAKHVADSERRRGEDPGDAERIGWATVNARKGFQLLSIDDYYDLVAKADARGAPRPLLTPSSPPPSVSDVASRPEVKKYPRKEKPTVRMKPISDAEAVARGPLGSKPGTREVFPHREKSLRWLAALKALATGYSKTSGGGALKAANREAKMPLLGPSGRTAGGKSGGHYRKRSGSGKKHFGPDGRPGPQGKEAKFGRLHRAMDAMSSPVGSPKPPKVYLPGLHNPKSPVRHTPGLKKPSVPKLSAPKPSVPKPSFVGKSKGKTSPPLIVYAKPFR